jgi:hypothetical protein
MQTLTIASLMNFLPDATDEARVKVANDAKWIERIDDAFSWLLEQDTVQLDGYVVLIESETSGLTYRVNGSCSCLAAQSNVMCKHRVRARLIKLALEKQKADAAQRIAKARSERWQQEIDELFI